MSDPCTWREDNVCEFWLTTCGEIFVFLADGPAENNFRFCPYCGGAIEEAVEKDETHEQTIA